MLVPKYNAQAQRGTGVAGQQMSFKVPGGALSQAAVAQGKAFEQLSSEAAQWGAAAYKMHRDSVVSSAVAEGRAAVDAEFNEAQRQDIDNPLYVEKGGGILGYFNDKIATILKSKGSTSFDPITNRRISADLTQYAADRRKTLNTYNAGRLVDQRRAQINAQRSDAVRRIANALPPDWDGNIETLPDSARVEYDNEVKRQLDAADVGIKTEVNAEKANRNLRSEITEYAVNTRISSARTTESVDQILGLLDNPDNFKHLKEQKRAALVDAAWRKYDRLLNAEYKNSERQRVKKSRDLRIRQQERATSVIARITRARETGDEEDMPDYKDILYLAELDDGRGLKDGHLTMLLNMLDDEGPAQTDSDFLNNLHMDVLDVQSENLSPEDAKRRIDAIIERSARQVGRGTLSRITIEDHLSFMKWAKTASKGELSSPEILNQLKTVKKFAAEWDPKTNFYKDKRDGLKVIEAERFYWLQLRRGATPSQAAMLALERVGVSMDPTDKGVRERTDPRSAFIPFYPVGLPAEVGGGPDGAMMPLPRSITQWEPSHVEASRQWVKENKTRDVMGRDDKERRQRYKRLMNDLDEISSYIANPR